MYGRIMTRQLKPQRYVGVVLDQPQLSLAPYGNCENTS
jgi:hypothetical protein